MLVGQLTQFGVIDGTGSRHNHSWGRVLSGNIVDELFSGEGANVLLAAQNGASEGRSLKGRCVQVIQDQFFLILVDFLHFSENDLPFSLNGLRLKVGVQQNVGNDFNGSRDILREDLRKVSRLFARCVGIEVSTHVFNLFLQLSLGAFLGSLKGHVFQKMGCSVVLGSLVTGARVDPNTDSSSFGTDGGFATDAESVREGSDICGWRFQDVGREFSKFGIGSSNSGVCALPEHQSLTRGTRTSGCGGSCYCC
mmetsp:Transcript_16010/g.44269  ORF Transcript_16010/g.44269 Transcript_16010/m.44269 type:complete len:252 (-) Transcript_16010:259-1014(-)